MMKGIVLNVVNAYKGDLDTDPDMKKIPEKQSR